MSIELVPIHIMFWFHHLNALACKRAIDKYKEHIITNGNTEDDDTYFHYGRNDIDSAYNQPALGLKDMSSRGGNQMKGSNIDSQGTYSRSPISVSTLRL